MNVFLAADHRGMELKAALVACLSEAGYAVHDCGPYVLDPNDDYPTTIFPAVQNVLKNPETDRAIIIGYSGQGEAMVANRLSGVRAAVYTGGGDEVIMLSREHNDANVLSFGAHFVEPAEACRLAQKWLETPFSGDSRHVRRLAALDAVAHNQNDHA